MQCNMPCKATKNTAKKSCETLCRLPQANHGSRGEHPTSHPSWAATCPTAGHMSPPCRPSGRAGPHCGRVRPAHGGHGSRLRGIWCNSVEWVWNSSTGLCFIASGKRNVSGVSLQGLDIICVFWVYRPGGVLLGGWLANRDSISAVGIVSRGAEYVGCCGFNRSQNIYFSLILAKSSFWWGDWVLGYHSMEFRHFPSVS